MDTTQNPARSVRHLLLSLASTTLNLTSLRIMGKDTTKKTKKRTLDEAEEPVTTKKIAEEQPSKKKQKTDKTKKEKKEKKEKKKSKKART